MHGIYYNYYAIIQLIKFEKRKETAMKYSILILTYREENPLYLEQCLESMFTQTLTSDDIVLVCDGGLTAEMYSVIQEYKRKYPGIFRALYLDKNYGTAYASNYGIKKCRNELIVKMDSDDIAKPNRCEKQIKVFENDKSVGICGGYISEFESSTGKEISVKKVPLSHEDIIKYSRRRNPINNPTLAFRKSCASEIGGYKNLSRCEDYEFICRMLANGVKAVNIPEILVDYRTTPDNYNRRRNWKSTSSFLKVRWDNYKNGYCSFLDFLIPGVMQIFMFLMPVKFTETIYRYILRK